MTGEERTKPTFSTVPGACGPVPPSSSRAALAATWSSGVPIADRLAAGKALCMLGDFSPRDQLFAAMIEDEVPDGVRNQLQHLVLSIATADQTASGALERYSQHIGDPAFTLLAASGRALLARHTVPLFVGIARAFEDTRTVTFGLAVDSGYDLSGVRFDECDDDATVEAWGDAVREVTEALTAPYILRGAPADPRVVFDEAIESLAYVARVGGSTPFPRFGVFATWSGVPYPSLPASNPTADDVERAAEYCATLARLPWRPGVKYFYGHDVDGGPGLHEVPSSSRS